MNQLIYSYRSTSFKKLKYRTIKRQHSGKTPTGVFHVLKVFTDRQSVSNMIAWHYDIVNYVAGRVPVLYYMEANFMRGFDA